MFDTFLSVVSEFAETAYHVRARRLTLEMERDLSISLDIPDVRRGIPMVAARQEEAEKMPSPACSVDIILTLHERGERLTREELVAALDKAKRRWSESVVGEVASWMTRAGQLTNVRPRGYGLPGWE